jgi:hypothetical protein
VEFTNLPSSSWKSFFLKLFLCQSIVKNYKELNKLSKKFQQIKQKPKKVKSNPDEWVQIAIQVSKKNKISWIKRIQSMITRKPLKDSEKEICKELIQRMDNRKMTYEEAQQMAIAAANSLQTSRKDLPRVLLYLIVGGLLLLTSIIFFIVRFPQSREPQVLFTDFNFVFWLIMICANGFLFYMGMNRRKIFEDNLIPNAILSQACAAYAACKSPGKGGSLFEAYQYLELIREKNKEAFNKQLPFGKKK